MYVDAQNISPQVAELNAGKRYECYAVEGSGCSPASAGMQRILVVTEDVETLSRLEALLRAREFQLDGVTADEITARPRGGDWNLAIVALSPTTPRGIGWERQMKPRISCPVLGVIPLDVPCSTDVLGRLDADDIVFSPLRIDELCARIDLLLWKEAQKSTLTYPLIERRRSPSHSGALTAGDGSARDPKGIVVNDSNKTVTIGSATIHLAPKEYQLLMLLASAPGRIFSAVEIGSRLWPRKRNSRVDVQQYVHLLRKKLEKDPENPKWLLTENGFGYKVNQVHLDAA